LTVCRAGVALFCQHSMFRRRWRQWRRLAPRDAERKGDACMNKVVGPPDPTSIPAEIRNRPQWVAWKRERENKKCPINPRTGQSASVMKKLQWGTVEAALDRMAQDHLAGIGFVFTADDPFVGIDLDKVIANGRIAPAARSIIDRFGTYTEVSPSGTGVHLIVRCPDFSGTGRRRTGIEVYRTGRYFTITGQPPAGMELLPIAACSAADLEALFPAPPAAAAVAPSQASAASPPGPAISRAGRAALTPEETVLIDALRSDPVFVRLFDQSNLADFVGDHSRADLGLLNRLVRSGVTDPEQLDRMFRASALNRVKWETRADYRAATIARALTPLGTPAAAAFPAVPSLPAIPSGEVDDVAALQARVAALRVQNTELRAQNAELQDQIALLTEQRMLTAEITSLSHRIASRRELGGASSTTAALFKAIASHQQAGHPSPYRISITSLVESSGKTRNTVSNHLKLLVNEGLLRIDQRKRHVAGTPGTQGTVQTETTMAIPGTARDFAEALLQLTLKQPRKQRSSKNSRTAGAVPTFVPVLDATGGSGGSDEDVPPTTTPPVDELRTKTVRHDRNRESGTQGHGQDRTVLIDRLRHRAA
jgi:putative DNA primase/helicase